MSQKAKHIRHTISITEAQRDAINWVATEEGLSTSDIARRAIAYYIKNVVEKDSSSPFSRSKIAPMFP